MIYKGSIKCSLQKKKPSILQAYLHTNGVSDYENNIYREVCYSEHQLWHCYLNDAKYPEFLQECSNIHHKLPPCDHMLQTCE